MPTTALKPSETNAPTEQTLEERIDQAEAELGKADAAVSRLRAELRAIPGRIRVVLEEVAEAGETGRTSAEEHLAALSRRRTELPGLIAVGEAIAAGAEVTWRELEQEQASRALARASAREREFDPPPGTIQSRSEREQSQMYAAAARRQSAQQAAQGAFDRLEEARQRLAAALAAALDEGR